MLRPTRAAHERDAVKEGALESVRATYRTHGRAVGAVWVVALTSVLCSIGLGLLRGVPIPSVQDEFSYLLAADTFAHGRLTNPPHPLWIHFETFHVIQQPTYASKYPPAQGLALAAGQVLFGHPVAGVWLSTALACVAACWMLAAWVRPRWALLGGLLVSLHPLVLNWSQSYWGGSVAMGGGALLLGGLRRIMNRPKVGDALWMSFGIAVLASSRPYEGLAITVLVGAVVIPWLFRQDRETMRLFLRQVVVPASAGLSLLMIWTGYYNYRVTGSVLRLPYAVYNESYNVAPYFVWQRGRPVPAYAHEILRRYHTGWESAVKEFHPGEGGEDSSRYSNQVIPKVFARTALRKLWRLFEHANGVAALGIPMLVLPFVIRRDRWLRVGSFVTAGFVVFLLLETWVAPHYAAPIASLVAAITVQSFRHLRVWQRRARVSGRALAWAAVGLYAFSSFSCLVAEVLRPVKPWVRHRAEVQGRLMADGTRHLVIVRYRPGNEVVQDWVYNGADIDGAKVVWAREMDAERNRALLEYFRDRRAWLLEADESPPRLRPYTGQ